MNKSLIPKSIPTTLPVEGIGLSSCLIKIETKYLPVGVLGAIVVAFTIFVPSSLLLFHFSLFNACLAVLALCVGIIFITITLP
jgi:hypothetical protein